MSTALEEHIRSTKDLGFFIPDTRTGVNQYEMDRKTGYPLEDMYKLVEAAGLGKDVKLFEKAVRSESADFRFWGAVGYAMSGREAYSKAAAQKLSGKKISDAIKILTGLLDDENPYVACEAAYALAYWEKTSVYSPILTAEVEHRSPPAATCSKISAGVMVTPSLNSSAFLITLRGTMVMLYFSHSAGDRSQVLSDKILIFIFISL